MYVNVLAMVLLSKGCCLTKMTCSKDMLRNCSEICGGSFIVRLKERRGTELPGATKPKISELPEAKPKISSTTQNPNLPGKPAS